MKCEVKKKTHCKPQTQEKCEDIKYTETEQIPKEVCTEEYIKIPIQEIEHKRKCLMRNNNNNTQLLTVESTKLTEDEKIFPQILGKSLVKSVLSDLYDPRFGPY